MSLNFHRRQLKPHEKGEVLRQYLLARGGAVGKNKGGRPSKNGKPRHCDEVSVAGIARELGAPEKTARTQIKAAETYASLPKSIKEKVDPTLASFNRQQKYRKFNRFVETMSVSCGTP